MSRLLAVLAAAGFAGLIASPVQARVGFPEGRACAGQWGAGPELVRIAGFFMASREIRPHQGNPFDTRAFQRCFHTVEHCQRWQASLSARYPLPPMINTCTAVRLR